MTIVLTNDDGVNAPGVARLRAAMLTAGLDVVVVAPAADQSGVSRAANYTNPVRVVRTETEGPPVYSVDGTPVDCVRVALGGGIVADAKLVVSGINSGGNVGDDMFNSGTVGAAIEAAMFDVPAIAISQQTAPGHFGILDPVGVPKGGYVRAADYGVAVAQALLKTPPATRAILNVNVPAQPPSGLRVTRLGKRLYERNSLTPLGKHGPSTYYLVYGSSEEQPTPHEDVEGTDFAALRAGFVSVTPVKYEHGHDNPADITGWAQRLITAAKSYLPQMH